MEVSYPGAIYELEMHTFVSNVTSILALGGVLGVSLGCT